MSQFVRLLSLAALCAATAVQADPARFDLTGPKVDIRVTRGSRTLPIAQVANLQPGDRLWLRPELPETQSVHLLLIAAFLRGTTNPPPDEWFTKIESWNKKVKEEGVFVTVPKDAQQALLFLAPETGGDFGTLKSAVRGRPGIFVRASQDLTELGFEQARIERYLAGMRQIPATNDTKLLSERSEALARTLALKPNSDCFNQPAEQQIVCLTQSGNQTLLDDGHGASIVTELANNGGADLAGAAASTAPFGGGAYSAYVGAVVDLTKLLTNMHTAQYQYIPAVAFPDTDHFNLRLNAAPSFHNPKSVIVIALPGIQPTKLPPLQPANPKEVTCLLKPEVVLHLQNAPLVFSTGIAHDLVLHVNTQEGKDIPLVADASKGGLVLTAAVEGRRSMTEDDTPTTSNPVPPSPDGLTGTVHGQWGFDSFDGPTLPLQNEPGKGWKLVSEDGVIVGREHSFTLASTGAGCVEKVQVVSGPKKINADFHPGDQSRQVIAKAILKDVNPGDLRVEVEQYGDQPPQQVETKAYTEAAKLTSFKLHAGDTTAILEGTSLDQVQSVELNGLTFAPTGEPDRILNLGLPKDAAAPKLKAGDAATAHAHLKDGRTVDVQATVLEARPTVTLVNRYITAPNGGTPSIRLSNKDDLPLSDRLTFFLKANGNFPRNQKIEVATKDGSLKTQLSFEDGTLVLQDVSTAIANLDPSKALGASAFGKLQFRAVGADGSQGDWQPLATLVRTPTLKEIRCPIDDTKSCHLVGSNLYLLKSVAATSKFDSAKEVPPGFGDSQLEVPRPYGTVLFVKLLDDPESVNAVALPVTPEF
ncbi:hypothetical protein FTW19_11235 [Terriglobus albidus]|uniref:Uncharacterized protein n=1 Tax=Terriglobus albidus TaxID=1592106 RepID=A0A5B9EDQ5_9BACT|nr:hypothetical protein [Terriglobus albidus]QEE28521.1 hypothetical protein FTW19_11235 [Terriglobus albidus]